MWYQLNIENCEPEDITFLIEEFEQAGALSITLVDQNDTPIFEPRPGAIPLWPMMVMQVLFSKRKLAEDNLVVFALRYPKLLFKIENIVDQDWERLSLDKFQPECFADKLWICPSWIQPPVADAINVILDPGLAFGTGSHPTTKLCLQWLANAELSDCKVVDYGCGSGILTIAAIKLGASVVQAIDIDAQALHATKANTALNSVSNDNLLINIPENLHPGNDIIIANIILDTLMELRDLFKKMLTMHGQLVVSGILINQVDQIIEYYAAEFTHITTQYSEDWALLCFRRI
ncbi:MAG: ribosomal protein L11 methyltransferase [Legionellales bacterium RIFCSPHIGHO2_12_FULL_42_9]|nr:MAG: ribosomal protein L11 methyltransferase [Legionellales bacterium RIFCSPHIGHO2_12_FULL_42_9]